MAIDYDKLSDAELEAIAKGDYESLSDATLAMIAGEKSPAAAPAAPPPAPTTGRGGFPLLPRDVRSQTDIRPAGGVSGLMGIPGGLLDIATGVTGFFGLGENEVSRWLREKERQLAEKAPVKETYEAGKIVPQIVPAMAAESAIARMLPAIPEGVALAQLPFLNRLGRSAAQAAGQAGQAYVVTPSAPEPTLSDLVTEKPREEGLFGLGPRGEQAVIQGGLGLAGEAVAPVVSGIVRGGRSAIDMARDLRANMTGRIRGIPTTPVTAEERAAVTIAQSRPGSAEAQAEVAAAREAERVRREQLTAMRRQQAEADVERAKKQKELLEQKKAAGDEEAAALEGVELTPVRGKQELGQKLRDTVLDARKEFMDERNQAIGKFDTGDEVPVFAAAKEMEDAGEYINSTQGFKDLKKHIDDRARGRLGKMQLNADEIAAYRKVRKNISHMENVKDPATGELVKQPVPVTFDKLVKLRRQIASSRSGVTETGYEAVTGKVREDLLKQIDNALEDFSPGYKKYNADYAEASKDLDFLKINPIGKKAATPIKFSSEEFQANPEAVLDALLNNPSRTNADNLLKFVGNKRREDVEQVVLEALVSKAGGKAKGYQDVLKKYDDFLEAFPTAKAKLQNEAGVFEKATAPAREKFEAATTGLEGIKGERAAARAQARIANAEFESVKAVRVSAEEKQKALSQIDENMLLQISEAANKVPLNTSEGLAQAVAMATIAGGAAAIAGDSPIAGILAIGAGSLGSKAAKNAFARRRKEVSDRIEEQVRKILSDQTGARGASIRARIDSQAGIANAQRVANQALSNLGIKPGRGAVTANLLYKAFSTDEGAKAQPAESAPVKGEVPAEPTDGPAPEAQSYDMDKIISDRGASDLAPLIKSIYEQESSSGKAEAAKSENYAGAKGPMQVTRDTFDNLRLSGLIPRDYSFDNQAHLAEAGVALIQQLGRMYDNDPQKVAAAYYGGPGAVTPQGIRRNRRDPKNPKAPSVGEYADQVIARLVPTAQAGERGMQKGGFVEPDAERQAIVEQIRKTPWFTEFVKEYGEEPDLSENADYDYVTAWKAGVRPERYRYDNNRFHWSSKTPEGVMLKKPGHPTLWKSNFMDQTGKNPDAIGIKTEEQAQQYLNSLNKKSHGGMIYSPAEQRLLMRYASR